MDSDNDWELSAPLTQEEDIILESKPESVADDSGALDVEVLASMENAADIYRKVLVPDSLRNLPEKFLATVNLLPPTIRSVAIENYLSFLRLREHFADVLLYLQTEFMALDDHRVSMRPFDPDLFRRLSPKFRNNFARSRKRLFARRVRLSCHIVRVRNKIRYLDNQILKHSGGPPPAPEPCSLCLLEGTGTLVLPREQPMCGTVGCKFVVCILCYRKLSKHHAVVPECPGCRSRYNSHSVLHVRKVEERNPFDCISDDEDFSEIASEDELEDDENNVEL